MEKKRIKEIIQLHHKKFRDQTGLFLVEGVKMVDELLKSNWTINQIVATEKWGGTADCSIEIVGEATFNRLSTLKNPNKVLAIVQKKSIPQKSGDVTLVLDGINDPGNFGTIIRTADWFGINTIYCSEKTTELYNSKVIQSAMGAAFRVRIEYCNLPNLLSSKKESHFICGAVMTGESLFAAEVKKPVLLVFGSESHGISQEVYSHISKLLTIPKKGEGESLNVAIACAVFCAHLTQK